MASVLVLIPARNEARTIGPIVEEVRSGFPVLVVDDGSTDDTAAIARKAGAEVVSHSTNLRKGAALKTGFSWAMNNGYEAVITMDADGQHDPADLHNFLDTYRNRLPHFIIGKREFSKMPWSNRFANFLGSRILSRALGVRVADNQSGFRLLTRHFLERMKLRSNGYEMEVEMIGEAVRLRVPIVWVPIRTLYFSERKSGFRAFRDTLRFLHMVWHVWRERVHQERNA